MRRALLLWLALAGIAWLQFEVFPGHTYLQSGTQVYVPMLERMESPGYLSRDLVAAHPNLSYTIYDEITLFLCQQLRLSMERALEGQLFFFRLAALLGAFLLARAARLSDLDSLLVAALLGLGATLPGAGICTVESEPVPMAMALGAAILAAGLLARGRPLAGGLAGGIALLYDPTMALPFWIVVLIAFCWDRRTRRWFRPALPILLIALLLAGNLAQLQPAAAAQLAVLGRIPAKVAELQQFRTPYVWVSLWGRELWHYLALVVLGVWAGTRVWGRIGGLARWLIAGMGLVGFLSVAGSYLLVDIWKLNLAAAGQPARLLAYTVIAGTLLGAVAAVQAAMQRKSWEAFAWLALVLAIAFDARVLDWLNLDWLRVGNGMRVLETLLWLGLAAAGTWLVVRLENSRARVLVLTVPLLAMTALAFVRGGFRHERPGILKVADWAEQNTWGSSVFLFPDGGRELYPGVFRAISKRALWVDWKSGMQVAHGHEEAVEWGARWEQTMAESFSAKRIEEMLPLPIDYYVVKRENKLGSVPAAFVTQDYYVYDAQDLKNAAPGFGIKQ
jgi:hypothetical protein